MSICRDKLKLGGVLTMRHVSTACCGRGLAEISRTALLDADNANVLPKNQANHRDRFGKACEPTRLFKLKFDL